MEGIGWSRGGIDIEGGVWYIIGDMGIFSAWQNKEVKCSVLSDEGNLREYTFRRIMVDYADALMETGSEEAAYAEVGCNAYDVKNWHGDYGEYMQYLEQRSEAKTFADSISSDFVYGLLGKAALGKVELSAPQIGALRLIMQGKALIAANGAQKKPAGTKFTSFGIEDQNDVAK